MALSQETGSVNSIVWMPFLDSIEEIDALLLRALFNLVADDSQDSVGNYGGFYSNLMISDGISDEESLQVLLAADADAVNPDLGEILLDPLGSTTETRTIELPLAGEVGLMIVRVDEGSSDSMDLLVESVEFVEDYMGEPFPVNTVLLLFADAVREGFAGHYSGANIMVHPDYDNGDSRHVIMHEVAHYYWYGSAYDWLDEGAAEFLSIRDLEKKTGRDAGDILEMGFRGDESCGTVDTLSELEKLSEDPEFTGCAYEMGLLFFFDLWEAVGMTDFQQGFRDLYLLGRDIFTSDYTDPRNIRHVRQAFGFSSEATQVVIPKWYEGK